MDDFSNFYEETYQSFFLFLIYHAPFLDHVEDILQDSYVKVYDISKRKKILNQKAYLYKIGWNLLKREFKLKKECEFLDEVHASIRNLEEEIDVKITLEELWNFLKDKDILVQKCIYFYYLGMSIEEIACTLTLKSSTVKNYLYRTFKEIREEWL